ncbi:hypothetical protein [Lactiplantibacillus fabifermentans]|uniref:SpoVT-AbrB domain-containing protein n=1 Tax=Lactiplantibacillus fabifermentans DSM 21115 TaxID=1413187 RepID=A0A0R2NRY1_9LACO|nr:hypothetical protein [Lactiplantibacillus fabifermentans]KRO28422.1 hypothetical protein DY78_GL002416 [Lactiplantibacillus fabifermentans DSM 21115]
METKINTTRVSPWDNSNGIILNKAILQEADIEVGDMLQVSTQQIHGRTAIVLETMNEPTLAEKYAVYQGTPETYEKPDDLKDWSDGESFGKEIW